MPSPPEVPGSPPTASLRMARRMLARELGGASCLAAAGATDVAAAGERLVLRLSEQLSRTFGPYGALALVARALTRTQGSNPALTHVTVMRGVDGSVGRAGGASVGIDGLTSAAGTASSAAAIEGLVAWLAALADLLGELIGDRLAATILDPDNTLGPEGSDADASTTAEER